MQSVKWLAKKSGITYTTLARLLLDSYAKRTSAPRHATVDRLARALRANTAWIETGQGVEQRSFWPAAVPEDEETQKADPISTVCALLTALRELPDPLRNRAYRSALASAIDTLSQQGHRPSEEAYECLMQLDALLITPEHRQAS